MPRIETIIDILGIVVKIDTILIEGILAKILEESKIDVAKIIVLKIDFANLVEDGRFYRSVDKVEVTSINNVLS